MKPLFLFCDLETYSGTSIKCGPHRYAETAEVLLWGYAVDDAPAKVWDLTSGAPMPADLEAALDAVLAGKGFTVWHNGMNFDTVVLKHAMGIDIPPERVIDTMVLAYEHGIQLASLAALSVLFKLPVDQAKDKDGARLVNTFCQPAPSNHKADRYRREDKPADWARFVNYCRLDIEAMRAVFKKMPKWNCTKEERRIQVLDAEINRRGMLMDVALARGALHEWEAVKVRYANECSMRTGGAVGSATQRDALVKFMHDEYGVSIQGLSRTEVERRLDDPSIPEPVKELLRLRVRTTKNSVAKYRALLDAVSSDGRLRGGLQFRGASRTGRFSGRHFQAQNLARPTMKNAEIEAAIEAVKSGFASAIYPDVGEVLANCLRGCIIAPEGSKLIIADYSNIEGRMLAWLAGEEWKLEAFREFDTLQAEDGSWVTPDRLLTGEHPPLARNAKGEAIHKGHDLYKVAYGKAFGIDPGDVTKNQRQVGKVLELALGYGGGVPAFMNFAGIYRVDLEAMACEVERTIDREHWEAAARYCARAFAEGKGVGTEHVFTACDAVKRAWRASNSNIEALWSKVGDAIADAIGNPGSVIQATRNVTADARGNYLRLRLPSGRYLVYANPRLENDGRGFSYMGANSYTRKWERIESRGAKAVENLTQGASVDILTNALLALDAAGYRAVLTVHDEIIAETPDTAAYSAAAMSRLMATTPEWAKGLPLQAPGFESHRYRKE